jgi:hypothetical protein
MVDKVKLKQWFTMLLCGLICGLFMWIAFTTQSGFSAKALVGAAVGGLITGALMQLMT